MGDNQRESKETREPLQCWGCGGDHMLRNFPLRNGNVNQVHNIQGTKIMGQVERTIPRIYAALEGHQEYHQSTVVEVEGKIVEQSISIFIDPRSTHNYITFKIVEICVFKKSNHNKLQLVQLDDRNKRKFSELVEKCPLVMDGLVTYANLNCLPLGSYDILIGMDWLEAQRVNIDCYNC